MIKAYEARKIADSFDRTKDLLKDIEEQIKKESQSGRYDLTFNWFQVLRESDIDYVLSILRLNGYTVTHKKDTVWYGTVVNNFLITWKRGELNENKP